MSGIENSVILSAVKAKFNFDFVPEHVKHKHTHTQNWCYIIDEVPRY